MKHHTTTWFHLLKQDECSYSPSLPSSFQTVRQHHKKMHKKMHTEQIGGQMKLTQQLGLLINSVKKIRLFRIYTIWKLLILSVLLYISQTFIPTTHAQPNRFELDPKERFPNLHRRGLLPGLLGNKPRRLPNKLPGPPVDNAPEKKPEGLNIMDKKPPMPPQQPKVRYHENPWKDTTRNSYKWPENQRAYFTCPQGYFIAAMEYRFGTPQTSVLRVPWNSKHNLFTLRDKLRKGLSPEQSEVHFNRMSKDKTSEDQRDPTKQFAKFAAAEDSSALSETGCDPVMYCLGHQACLFKVTVDLCAADPVPGNRKMFFVSVSCAKDSLEGDYATDTSEFNTMRRERDQVLYLTYEAQESTSTKAVISLHSMTEEEIFGITCPTSSQALQNGYAGWCTLDPPKQSDITHDLWNVLGRVAHPECRRELTQAYCAYHYNTTAGCLPPTYVEPRTEGIVPKAGEVHFSFNALPKRGVRPDLTTRKKVLADPHVGLIPCTFGFLILAHNNPEAVGQLLDAIYRPHHFYVLHIDYRADTVREALVKKASELAGQVENIRVLPKSRSFIASWGSFEIVRAEMEAYEELLRMGAWDFAINLSGADLPTRDVDDIAAMLAPVRHYNFMRQNGNWNDRSDKPTDFTVWYACGGHVYNVSSRGHRPSWTDMHSTSQWTALNRDFLDFVLDPLQRGEKINYLQFYSMTSIIPDESFFPSMLKISPFRSSFIHYNFHHLKAFARKDEKGFCRHTEDIDFCGQGPGTIQEADGEYLNQMSLYFFFSRKFVGDPSNKARMKALDLAKGGYYDNINKRFVKFAMIRQLVEMVMEDQYGSNWEDDAEVQDILKIRIIPIAVTVDPCCVPIYSTKNQISRDAKYWIDFSLHEKATNSVRVLRASFVPQSRTNCFTRGHLRALYLTSEGTQDRKVPVRPVNIVPHETAGGNKFMLVSYINLKENFVKAEGCNEIENLPDDSFDHRTPESFSFAEFPKNAINQALHFNASFINDVGDVKCFLEVVVTFKKPSPTIQHSDTVRFINNINCGPLTPGYWTVVLFQKGVKEPFPYTAQVYLAEDNGENDWDKFSLNDAVYGLWLIEDVRSLGKEDYPNVVKLPQPYEGAKPQGSSSEVEAKNHNQEEEDDDSSSFASQDDNEDKQKSNKANNKVKKYQPRGNRHKVPDTIGNGPSPTKKDEHANNAVPINVNTQPDRKRLKLRESLQRGLVDSQRQNQFREGGKRHAMQHNEGSNLAVVADKTKSHIASWRNQSFLLTFCEFLAISIFIFIFVRSVFVPLRIVKRRSTGVKSFVTFVIVVTLFQVLVYTIVLLSVS